MVHHGGQRQQTDENTRDPPDGFSFLFGLTQLVSVQLCAHCGHSRNGSTDYTHGKLLTDMNGSNSITLKKEKLKVEPLGLSKLFYHCDGAPSMG